MRKIGAALVLALWASVAGAEPKAQYVWLSATAPFTCNAMQEGAIYQNTTDHLYYYCNASAWTSTGGAVSGTQNTLVKFTSSSAIGNATPLTSTDSVPADGSTSFLTISGTFPTTPTGATIGANVDITSAGNQAFEQRALQAVLHSGYTGSSRAMGILSTAISVSSGETIGMVGTGQNTGAGFQIGGLFRSPFNGGPSVGLSGYGGNPASQVSIGGLFYLSNSATLEPSSLTTLTSAVLLLDTATTSAQTVPLITGRDGGVVRYMVSQNGDVWTSKSKTLTDAAAAVAFATVTLSSGSATGGQIDYCIEVIDTAGTPDRQNRCGGLVYTAVNKAGTLTITCARPSASVTLDNTTDTLAASSGTMTDTFTCVDGGSGVLQFKVTADSSLTVATERINYSLRQWGNAAVTFTPQ